MHENAFALFGMEHEHCACAASTVDFTIFSLDNIYELMNKSVEEKCRNFHPFVANW